MGNTLERILMELEDTKESLLEDGGIIGEYLYDECRLIMEGKINFEESVLCKEIKKSRTLQCIESFGYEICWDIYVEKLRQFYKTSGYEPKELDKLYQKMSDITKHRYGYFDFRIGKWIGNV